MSKQKQRLPRLAQAAGLCLLFAISACETRVPNSDQTPPRIFLYVINYEGNGDVREITNDTTLPPVSPKAEFWIIAAGQDDQGIRGVSLSFGGSTYCRSGDVAVTQFIDGGDSNFEDPSVGVGDVALDRRIATVNVRGSIFYNCPSGYSFVNASSTYQATALNFHGG